MIKKIFIFIIYLLYHTISVAQSGLIINEIMYNPNNSLLSSHEYIELYNNGTSTIQLNQFIIQVNNNTLELQDIRISPKQYLIITSADGKNDLEKYGNVAIPNTWYSLSNTSATLRIKKNESIIDEITYQNNWHNTTKYRNGGFSLERINPNWICNNSQNWHTSTHPMGATPGKLNSINKPQLAPLLEITNFEFTNNQVTLFLNTLISNINSLKTTNFEFLEDKNTATHIAIDATNNSINIFFDKDIISQRAHTLIIKDINICNLPIQSLKLTLFKQPILTYNCILINEILFNPKPNGVDFVELYNNTTSPINIQNWKIGNRIITKNIAILEPYDFIALTTNKDILITQYPNAYTENIFQVDALPAFANQKGNVTLYDNNNNLIDSLYYNAKMHHPLIVNEKGISLERQSYLKETNSTNNFKSASTLVGGATPGYQNSSNVENFFKKNNIFLSSKIISPNNDLIDDFLEINYELLHADYIINITIFDEKGRVINRLIRQQKIGDKGKIQWDGTAENGSKCTAGHYIIKADLFDLNGDNFTFKAAFALTYNALNY